MKKSKIKRLFLDIETSPNTVFSWNVGYKLNISHDNILKERAIICICYKWEDSKTVHFLSWNKGDDKKMVLEFVKIMQSADELIGHNGDNYDIKFLRARAIFHGVTSLPDFITLDTLKISRTKFRFNSNKLDYISKYLGFGGKIETGGFGLWKDICLNNSSKALNNMINYCKKDVILLEKVYNKLKGFTKHKTHIGVLNDGSVIDCPHCGSDNIGHHNQIILASGMIKHSMKCRDCGKYHTVSDKYIRTNE